MQIVYWAHSYRKEDNDINQHFGRLIEDAERMVVNFDPPSDKVNESKLDQNLRSCDGLVAVLTWRGNGPSKYILHEIALSLRARKPLLVFMDDRISGGILPDRILQRRFSHRTFFRQSREHTHALRALKSYMGEPPPARYQPNTGQRICGVIGLASLDKDGRETVRRFILERGYQFLDLDRTHGIGAAGFDRYESLANLEVAVVFVDSGHRSSAYWSGAVSAASIPTITITLNADYPFSEAFPLEFQPRLAHAGDAPPLEEVLKNEFDLFEQDFLKTQDPRIFERYFDLQKQAGALGGRYESRTRDHYVEYIMGDKNIVSGQAGAVGSGAHAHNMTFSGVWNRVEKDVDLAKLAEELARLHAAMASDASSAEQKMAAGSVAAAEQSAREKQGPKVVEYLKTGGVWALTVAEKIGVTLAAAVIKESLGS